MKELNAFRKFLSENALANDKGDGTFEVTSDIDILGKKFNFSDICPSAHTLISDLADEYEGRDIMLGDLLYLANLHQTFFNIEKRALGPQGINADEYDEARRLYVEIHNIATNAFGADVTKDVAAYMDMHMAKIDDALNIERDEDGSPIAGDFKASEPGGSSDMSFEEALAEVRNRLGVVVEGYTDLHKNDICRAPAH